MIHLRPATCLLLLAAFAPFRCAAQVSAAAQPPPENAAVKYLRADASLRQSYPLAPDAAQTLQKALQAPLDDADEKLVAAADDALVEFDHGAALPFCNWDLSADGNTAHRGAITELVAVSGLRARLRFRDGNSSGAVSDVLASMAAERHLSLDGSLASVLFSYKMEQPLVEILAANLYRLSPAQLKELAGGLQSLPAGSTMAAAFAAEKVRRNERLWDIARGANTRDELIAALQTKIPLLHSDYAAAAQIVDGCGGSVAGFKTCVERESHFDDAWASRFDWPPTLFETTYKAEMEDRSKTNPVILQFTPMLPRFRWAEIYNQTHRGLLQAAVDVQLRGPDALSQHPDPHDGAPFSYHSIDGGFRLQSRLSENKVPLSLTVAAGPENLKVNPK
ncbi:MAG: hypothetical protein ABSD87_11800 [Candidatus Acidiferrales bacterium]